MSIVLIALVNIQAYAEHSSGAGLQTLDSFMSAWLKRPDLAHSLIGLEVMQLPHGRVLYSSGGNRRFTPASTAKIFTTACAYEVLGPAFTYKTRLLIDGSIVGHKLHGNAVLQPSQDPTFTRDNLRQLLSSLKQKGISRIEGAFKIAPVPGGLEQFYPGWLSEDWGQDWIPVSSNLVVDRNVVSSEVALHGARISIEKAQSINNSLSEVILRLDLGAGWISYDPDFHSAHIFKGSSQDARDAKQSLVVANPDEFNKALAISVLHELGISISGHGTRDDDPKSGTILAEHSSRPLSTIIRTTLHESDNLYAQQILRTIGLFADKKVRKYKHTLEDYGLERIKSWLSSIGVPPQEVILFDGCGLSRKNCVTPHALNMVLCHMAKSSLNGPYLSLLKVNDRSSARRGIFMFKTGAMDTVRSVAGIIHTTGGQTLATTVLINGHNPYVKELRASIATLIDRLTAIESLVIKPLSNEKQQHDVFHDYSGSRVMVEINQQLVPSASRRHPKLRSKKTYRHMRHNN